MKILYISLGDPDYLCDTVLHGLYSILGEELTHTDNYDLMYSTCSPDRLKKIYGKGFTVWGLLPKYLNDNSDINNKITNRYFDYIIYGSIHRCRHYIDIVRKYYKTNEIVFLDGEDHNVIFPSDVIYFKRELTCNVSKVYPISFSIPEEKICDNSGIIKKEKSAEAIPNFAHHYLYSNEKDYYNGYRGSYFGITHKKAGWDCMRHYEILANYCIPYFIDIEKCPVRIMTNFPKELVIKSKYLYDKDLQGTTQYYGVLNALFKYTKTHLLTKHTAKYIIDVILKNKS